MYFTLAVSAATAARCAVLTGAALGADPRVMPVPGPARVAWRAPDGRAAILHWGDRAPAGLPTGGISSGGLPPGGLPSGGLPSGGPSHAGTIWAEGDTIRARTALTRVDPVYLAEGPGAVVVSDRASWAAAVTGRLRDPDPVMIGAFLSLGYPLGSTTPFRGVRTLPGDRALRAAAGRLAVTAVRPQPEPGKACGPDGAGGAGRVAEALAGAVRPLGEAAEPVQLSLTGGKDSRLAAAALTAAGVPFTARTHGSARHPDVIVAGLIARHLGLEHTVTEPAAPGSPDEADVLGRLRATVLVSDGMLSAFENTGSGFRPDPAPGGRIEAGGHGGELLRGGYAQAAWRTPAPLGAAAAAELFRRMTTRRLGLLRPEPARAYLASLAPAAVTLARGPLAALDGFYLANRAGRWSAAARQAYLLRSPLAQPLFADPVVRAARAVPLRYRMSDRLHRDVLGLLCPGLLDIPLAGAPWRGEPRTPATVLTAPRQSASQQAAPADWRLDLAGPVSGFLRGYVLDHGQASVLFGIVSRRAAERSLALPQADPHAAWGLATLAALLSGDWLSAREPAARAATAAHDPGRA
jgi:asparagine synthase (glutamine-hydrolysing)